MARVEGEPLLSVGIVLYCKFTFCTSIVYLYGATTIRSSDRVLQCPTTPQHPRLDRQNTSQANAPKKKHLDQEPSLLFRRLGTQSSSTLVQLKRKFAAFVSATREPCALIVVCRIFYRPGFLCRPNIPRTFSKQPFHAMEKPLVFLLLFAGPPCCRARRHRQRGRKRSLRTFRRFCE